MNSNRVGRVVLQNKNGVLRYGVITTQQIKQDGWLYYTIYWISKTNGQTDWMHQIEWRHDAVRVVDEETHLNDLQTAIRFRDSRKFKEAVS